MKFSTLALLLAVHSVSAFAPSSRAAFRNQIKLASTTEDAAAATNENVAQTENTSRDKVMTFSYDMSTEAKYEKPTYPGTGNGLSGDAGDYDVVVIGSGMGGLACGAMRYVVLDIFVILKVTAVSSLYDFYCVLFDCFISLFCQCLTSRMFCLTFQL